MPLNIAYLSQVWSTVKHLRHFFLTSVILLENRQILNDLSFMPQPMGIRYHLRFFAQVGHETTCVSSGNKHFFTK